MLNQDVIPLKANYSSRIIHMQSTVFFFQAITYYACSSIRVVVEITSRSSYIAIQLQKQRRRLVGHFLPHNDEVAETCCSWSKTGAIGVDAQSDTHTWLEARNIFILCQQRQIEAT